MIANDLKYKHFRFPIAVISQAIFLYNRFSLSYRDVSDLLFERGIVVSHQTIKKWNVRFGVLFAEEIKKRRRSPTRRWHIDEMPLDKLGTWLSAGSRSRERSRTALQDCWKEALSLASGGF